MNKKTSEKKSEKIWKIIAYVLLLLQAVFSVAALAVVVKIDMLPVPYVIAFVVVLLILFLAADLFMIVSKANKKSKKSPKVRRGIGCGISAFSMIVCIVLIALVSKLDSTIDNVAGNDVIITDTTAVFVMNEDPAKELTDVKDYTFAITKSYDYENTKKTVDVINTELNKEITIKEYNTVIDMIDALYNGEVGALLLNETYLDILEDIKEYKDFPQKTRVIFENRIESIQKAESEKPKNITEDPFIIYLSGSDTRSTTLSKSRSDVNILAIVNQKQHQVLMINTPRDYYVDISIGNGAKDKLTHCGAYGIQCSMDTLGALYGTKVDYSAQINFAGFETLVNAVGGVVVESDASFTSDAGYSYVKGENYLDGAQALSFARERHALGDGDVARGRHQMAIIKALAKKMMSGSIITKYADIMDSLDGMFLTDVSSSDVSKLVKMQLEDGGEWDFKSFYVMGKGTKMTTYTMPTKKSYVMIPYEEDVAQAKSLIQKVLNGELVTDADLEKKQSQ